MVRYYLFSFTFGMLSRMATVNTNQLSPAYSYSQTEAQRDSRTISGVFRDKVLFLEGVESFSHVNTSYTAPLTLRANKQGLVIVFTNTYVSK